MGKGGGARLTVRDYEDSRNETRSEWTEVVRCVEVPYESSKEDIIGCKEGARLIKTNLSTSGSFSCRRRRQESADSR